MQRLAARANAWASTSASAIPTTRPLAHAVARSGCRRQHSTAAPAEPFKILFCGSDAFSIAALDAVLGAEGKRCCACSS